MYTVWAVCEWVQGELENNFIKWLELVMQNKQTEIITFFFKYAQIVCSAVFNIQSRDVLESQSVCCCKKVCSETNFTLKDPSLPKKVKYLK